ncbi:MAG TPA: DUF2202 domain-containing protein [Campylobacterales bacterium]|nr:DUF2202 domain-containing protein [Campylobacterales bacterium]
MGERNFDSETLLSKRVNPTLAIPTMHQALRIALYDEYHARAVYTKVIENFGAIAPFSNIVEAENRHIAELLVLFEKYGVAFVIDDWADKVGVEASLVENCEIGVAAEIENIKMYDNLMPYAETPDVLDAFFRLQAASYNNHLPAFRRCVAQTQNSAQNPQNSANSQKNVNHQELFDSIKGLMSGSPNLGAMRSIVEGMGTEFIVGAAAGAVILGLVSGGGLSELLKE